MRLAFVCAYMNIDFVFLLVLGIGISLVNGPTKYQLLVFGLTKYQSTVYRRTWLNKHIILQEVY